MTFQVYLRLKLRIKIKLYIRLRLFDTLCDGVVYDVAIGQFILKTSVSTVLFSYVYS